MPTLFARHVSLRTIILSIGVLALCGTLMLYVAFQARHILEGPVITLASDASFETSLSTVVLSGIARNITSLSLNGRTIYTDDTGAFTETLVLPVGYTIMTLTAKDRYGRVHSLEQTYVRNKKENINHT